MGAETRKTVLLVDDDLRILKALGMTLQREGYCVHTAANTREALRQLVRHGEETGLLICDLCLAHEDGMVLLQHVGRRRPSIARIVLTAFGDWQSYGAAIESGVREFLSKPIRSDQLLRSVRDAIGPARASRLEVPAKSA
jgi:two-component system alkaline phosphatase synthesis response regulator PhoP